MAEYNRFKGRFVGNGHTAVLSREDFKSDGLSAVVINKFLVIELFSSFRMEEFCNSINETVEKYLFEVDRRVFWKNIGCAIQGFD